MQCGYILLVFASVCAFSYSSFLALSPKIAYPGTIFNVAVTVHSRVKGSVDVTASLMKSNFGTISVGTAHEKLLPGETKLLSVLIPLLNYSTPTLELTVSATGGVEFSNREIISLSHNSSVTLVQTDKAIYKPGQKVRIRVVNIDKDLKPIFVPVTIIVENAKNDKLEEYKDVTTRNGVVEQIFTLSDHPSLGIWKIHVEIEGSRLHTATFKVEEFVLPKFSVQVTTNPSFLIMSSKNPSVKVLVNAVYTYGKGVQGRCELTVHYSQLKNEVIHKKLNSDGSAEIDNFDWSMLSPTVESVTLVAAVVDETGRREQGEAVLTVYRKHIRVKLLNATTTILRSGLRANIFAEVSDHFGNPVSPISVEVSVAVPGLQNEKFVLLIPANETVVHHTFIPVRDAHNGYYYYGREGTITVKVRNEEDIMDKMNAYFYKSQSNVSLAIKPLYSQMVNVSETVSIGVDKMLPKGYQSTLSYVVLSKGNMVDAGMLVNDYVDLVPTLEYCPLARVLVYMIVGDGTVAEEVVVDSLDLSVSGCFNKEVHVAFDSSETRTGAEVDMEISVSRLDGSNSMPGIHDVFYLAVDQSIVLLQGSTDLNKDKVAAGWSHQDIIKASEVMDSAHSYFARFSVVAFGKVSIYQMKDLYDDYYYDRIDRFNWDDLDYQNDGSGAFYFKFQPLSDNRTWQTHGLQRYSLTCLTTAHISKAGHHRYNKMFEMADVLMVNKAAVGLAPRDELSAEGSLKDASYQSGSAGRVRKNFPDTWLWGHAETNSMGHMTAKVTVPDTITSWIISAFAINEEGLAVTPQPFKLTAFQLFFLSMNLPYSIKRGEIFVLRVTVFNYRNISSEAVVSLAHSDQFLVLDEENTNGWYEKPLSMEQYKASSVSYRINATSIGYISLNVTATDTVDGQKDKVQRNLLVKPEGVERSRALTKVMILKSGSTLSESFSISWPQGIIVPDSQRVELKVTGEVFGQALSNLESLVSMPYGCGEQNMISTVPNIFGLKYIKNTGQLGMEELEAKLAQNMKFGYIRQVENYRHSDGSFSAWGERNYGSVGSTWLTAFVIRSFAQASKFISVDSNVLASGIQFLKSRQVESGRFMELGTVIHSDMQSGTGTSEALTVYVLISMLEASEALGQAFTLKDQIDIALKYVVQQLKPDKMKTEKNQFLLAMAAYCLSLSGDMESYRTRIMDLLKVITETSAPWGSVETGDVKPIKSKQLAEDVVPPYIVHHHASRDLETAAYVLLTYTRLRMLPEGLELMKWLQSKQNSKGGFYSTQDTVMVLQALSEFGSIMKQGSKTSNLQVTDPVDHLFPLSGSRSMLLQSLQLPSDTTKVNVTLSGDSNSIAVVKVVYTYYTLAGEDDAAPAESLLFLETKTSKLINGHHRVQACVKSSKTLKNTGMFVTTMTLPSGEKPADDINTLMASNPMVSRVETQDRLIHFYMDQVPSDSEYCLTANVESDMEFEVQKPGSIQFYSYYDPANVAEVPLSLSCHQCDTGTAVNMASVLLTTILCMLVSLLACM